MVVTTHVKHWAWFTIAEKTHFCQLFFFQHELDHWNMGPAIIFETQPYDIMRHLFDVFLFRFQFDTIRPIAINLVNLITTEPCDRALESWFL